MKKLIATLILVSLPTLACAQRWTKAQCEEAGVSFKAATTRQFHEAKLPVPELSSRLTFGKACLIEMIFQRQPSWNTMGESTARCTQLGEAMRQLVSEYSRETGFARKEYDITPQVDISYRLTVGRACLVQMVLPSPR